MEINFVAVLVAALIPMLLGFVWYNKNVFGNAWMQATGMTEEKARAGNMAVVFGVSFVMSLLMAYIMNIIAVHDAYVNGAMYYALNGAVAPEPGSELARWLAYYQTNLANSNHTFAHGAFHGALVGGMFIALPVLTTNALFEQKSFKYIAINACYWIICLGLMGGIVAAWR